MSEFEETQYEVIPNSDVLARAPFETIPPFEPEPIGEAEKRMLQGTKSIPELLEEEETEAIEPITEEQIKKMYVTKLKVVGLHHIGLHPLTNPSTLQISKQKQLLEVMYSMQEDLTEEVLTKKFNDVCNDQLFDNSEYWNFPIYR